MKKQDQLDEINEAMEDYKVAMLENVNASRAIVDAQTRKTKAHYTMMKASERLHALQVELMQNI